MEDYKYLKQIEEIDKSNSFLQYIVDRVISDDYRGFQCSQHNRLTYSYFFDVIMSIYEIADCNIFRIHIGDDIGKKQIEAKTYYEIVNKIKKSSGKGTINSVKKNTFPDIARMGFLERFDKNDNRIIENYSRSSVYSVCLSELGLKFINGTNFDRIKMFTDGVDKITKNAASQLVELLYLNDYGIDYIDLLEFMYIISDDREFITINDKLQLLLEYRHLSKIQLEKVHDYLKKFCNPKNRKNYNNKTLLRDYSNWKNESQQIYLLLSNSTYFKVENDKLVLNTGKLGLFDAKTNRGEKAKRDYFKIHNIAKASGYELHHIVPFSKAQNKSEALCLDDYRNLIYLKSDKHFEFSKYNNKNVIMKYIKNNVNVLFLDFEDGYIIVDLKKDTLISELEISRIQDYNRFLLKKFYQYE